MEEDQIKCQRCGHRMWLHFRSPNNYEVCSFLDKEGTKFIGCNCIGFLESDLVSQIGE